MSNTHTLVRLPKYLTIEKTVGETPLVALERLRKDHNLSPQTPLAYAGRLDPMASGKLLVLVGDECKVQEKYHAFDKEYEVDILLGVTSDSGDVLGKISMGEIRTVTQDMVKKLFPKLHGVIRLPYPHFSSKTVKGKPLHTWTLENRLDEIEIPIKESRIYKLQLIAIETITKEEIMKTVTTKIGSIPPVADARKALGADFRRSDVRASWRYFETDGAHEYQVLRFVCIASSGTYMRTLSEVIARHLGTCGLAYHIHRTQIGRYIPFTQSFGFWTLKF